MTFTDGNGTPTTSTTCWDVSGVTLTGNTNVADLSYQWYVSNVSSGSGFSKYTGSGSTSASIGITSNSVTRYYRRSRVYTSGSTTDSNIAIITVYALPTISGTLSVCKGLTRTLTGSGESGTWSSDNASATVSSTGVVTGVSAGTANITYTDGNNCSVTESFTVHPLPTVSAGTDQTTCLGESVSLSATVDAGTSFSWNNSVSNNVAFSPSSTNTYTVVGVDGNGCIATDEVQVTVLPLPTISGGSTVCVGTTITLTGSGSPSTSTPWESSVPGVATVSSNGVVNGVSSGTTTIKYTDVYGCEQTHDVTVNGLPAVNAGTDFSTCEGSQISLSGGGANSYSWDNGVTNGSLFTATSTTTYTVTGTNSNNCVNTDQITVTVNPVPTISGATTVCEGETISLSVDLSSGTWDSDDDGVATVSASGVVTGVGNGTTNVTYVVNGCIDTYSVTVHSKPTISGTFTATAGGSSVTLSASGTAFGTNGWNSSTTSVATISASGEVTPGAAGTTDITF
ncbi:Ig-like domain-containing protein, partial [Schleiferiaceae bacterium]|nr:Ig-like domain-containing protein [Schleiferiaceae bacterium]